MPLAKFGPFACAFETVELAIPGYLELLNLQGPGADIAIDRIRHALALEEPRRWIEALFDEPNWRPRLVGAVALLLDGGARRDTVALWHAVDCGRWVTAQLVVIVYFADPAVPEHLVQRIRNHCQVTFPASLPGPQGTPYRSAKLLASLLAIGRRIPALSAFLQQAAADPELAELLAKVEDHAADITDSWAAQVVALFAARHHVLLRFSAPD